MGISNNDFGDAVLDQVLATTSQCNVFVFEENYCTKVLCDDSGLKFANYHALDQSGKDKYDDAARELVAPHLIIKNSLYTRAGLYLKDQYFVNQLNHPNTVIAVVAVITSFGSPGGKDGNGGNTNISNTDAIISLHLADYSDNCCNNNDRSNGSFKSIANNGRASKDDVPITDAVVVANDLENDNINESVITGDDDDSNNNDNNEADYISSNDEDNNSDQEGSMPNNANTISMSNHLDVSTPWMQLVAITDGIDDTNDNNPDNYMDF